MNVDEIRKYCLAFPEATDNLERVTTSAPAATRSANISMSGEYGGGSSRAALSSGASALSTS